MLKAKEFSDDFLLGGAAMSIDDLKIVESQEIRWFFARDQSHNDQSEDLSI